MTIEPIDPLEPPSVVDGPWWTGPVEPVAWVEGPQAASSLDRDPRAEALGIAQHGTAYIPAPVMPSFQDLRRRRPPRFPR